MSEKGRKKHPLVICFISQLQRKCKNENCWTSLAINNDRPRKEFIHFIFFIIIPVSVEE